MRHGQWLAEGAEIRKCSTVLYPEGIFENNLAVYCRERTRGKEVPEGRLKFDLFSAVPSGLELFSIYPAVNCRAIVNGSFGTKAVLQPDRIKAELQSTKRCL